MKFSKSNHLYKENYWEYGSNSYILMIVASNISEEMTYARQAVKRPVPMNFAKQKSKPMPPAPKMPNKQRNRTPPTPRRPSRSKKLHRKPTNKLNTRGGSKLRNP